ncbi:MAG: hypothetical protein AAGA48_15330 [Myxococcota bacterium]
MTPPGRTYSDRLDTLILIRLSVPIKHPTPSALRAPMERYVVPPLPKARWPAVFQARIENLRRQGLVERYRLTPRGQLVLKGKIGVTKLPWRDARPVMAALAMGLDARDASVRRQLKDGEAVVGAVLNETMDLGLGLPSMIEAVDRLAFREMTGKEGELTLDVARAFFLERLIGGRNRRVRGDVDRLARMVAARVLGAPGTEVDELVTALTQQWLTGTRSPERDMVALETFARRVLDVAGTIHGNGRFGERKVFIAAVWRALTGDRIVADLTLGQFKDRLCQAHQAGLLNLERADLVGAMDINEVNASEAHVMNATFHFVEAASVR